MTRPRRRPAAPPVYPNRHGAYRKAEVRDSYGEERRLVNDTESVLRQLEFLGVLTARQREAGEKLEADYWLANASTAPRDSLDLTPRGQDHETDSRAEAVQRAAHRVSKAKRLAGSNYRALRDLAAYRVWVKRAAMFLPALLDLIGSEVYRLPDR